EEALQQWRDIVQTATGQPLESAANQRMADRQRWAGAAAAMSRGVLPSDGPDTPAATDQPPPAETSTAPARPMTRREAATRAAASETIAANAKATSSNADAGTPRPALDVTVPVSGLVMEETFIPHRHTGTTDPAGPDN